MVAIINRRIIYKQRCPVGLFIYKERLWQLMIALPCSSEEQIRMLRTKKQQVTYFQQLT